MDSVRRIARRIAERYDSGFGTVDYTCDRCGRREESRTLPDGWIEEGREHWCGDNCRNRAEQVQQMYPQTSIAAECHSDDYAFQIKFDALDRAVFITGLCRGLKRSRGAKDSPMQGAGEQEHRWWVGLRWVKAPAAKEQPAEEGK